MGEHFNILTTFQTVAVFTPLDVEMFLASALHFDAQFGKGWPRTPFSISLPCALSLPPIDVPSMGRLHAISLHNYSLDIKPRLLISILVYRPPTNSRAWLSYLKLWSLHSSCKAHSLNRGVASYSSRSRAVQYLQRFADSHIRISDWPMREEFDHHCCSFLSVGSQSVKRHCKVGCG